MKDILKLFSLKFVSAILGLVSSIITVRLFGASRTIEVYFAAQSLVYLVTSLTQSGQLAEIFLPEYHKLNSKAEGLGFEGLNVVINRFFIWGIVIIGLVFLISPVLIKLMVPGFDELEQEESVLIFRVLLPYLLLQLFNSFFITVLNAEKKYGRAEFLGISNVVVNIIVLLVLYKYLGVWAIVISVLFGKMIEFVFYLSQLYKIGFRYKFTFSILDFDHSTFFKTMQSTFLYVGSTQIYMVVLTAGISFLPEGTYAIFKYVQGLSNKIKGLVVQPFMTIFFTTYSSLLHRLKSVKEEFNKYFKSIICINVVTIIGTVLLGDIFIDILWGGKKFTSEDVQLAYVFLVFYGFSILFSSIGGVYRKMSVAHGFGKQLYQLWVVSQLISALLSYTFLKYFQVKGLFLIIPVNTLLMSLVSIIVYYKTKKPIKYSLLNLNNLFFLILIVISYIIKSNLDLILDNRFASLSIFLVTTVVLSIYPIINIYKIFRK
ncbi:oligosaccharide flippase family protein [Polaribacter pectinis]|uniref:Oligosaccharide flippase family protein n=1 Tax=Polaribacter pectinis TaxID=2738844 RepID=A0A7G9LAX4_9FLAO|nr:lipid II flippase MurJ [Polaribacter pectinis]QNM85773.1 oligosaccharide flippase family protein [Polaribacter pectinis]